MDNKIFPKGRVSFPYDVTLLQKVVTMSGGKMSEDRFTCTLHSKDQPGMWTMPSRFHCRFEVKKRSIAIDYQVFPSMVVWLLLFLPVLALIAVTVFQLETLYTSATAFLTGAAMVCYHIQRTKTIERFEKRFGA